MMRTMKIVVVALLALVLAAMLLPGCGGGGGGGGTRTITIGEINDLTGAGSSAMQYLHFALQDVIRQYNDEGLIPGVKIKLVTYDDRADPARAIPGYDWCKQQGAKAVVPGYAHVTETLKPFAETDKVPLFAQAPTLSMLEDPKWVFGLSEPGELDIQTLLKWISENDWDYSKGIPKIGFAGWSESNTIAFGDGIIEYCQAHPDEFDCVAKVYGPEGIFNWSGYLDSLKGCDFVFCGAPAGGYIIKQFTEKGYHTTFIGGAGQGSFVRFLAEMDGWAALDGMLSTFPAGWWSETSPVINQAKELLQKYRAGEAEDIMASGNCYQGGMQSAYVVLEILRNAIVEVGPENLDGQAIYNAAVNYKTEGTIWEGRPQWGFTETHRYIVGAEEVYEWSAEKKDLIMASNGWVPLVEQP